MILLMIVYICSEIKNIDLYRHLTDTSYEVKKIAKNKEKRNG